MSDTPIDLGSTEWTMYRFHEIDEDDLFWLTKNPGGSLVNPVHKKLNENTALNLVAREYVEMKSTRDVYIKEQ